MPESRRVTHMIEEKELVAAEKIEEIVTNYQQSTPGVDGKGSDLAQT